MSPIGGQTALHSPADAYSSVFWLHWNSWGLHVDCSVVSWQVPPHTDEQSVELLKTSLETATLVVETVGHELITVEQSLGEQNSSHSAVSLDTIVADGPDPCIEGP
jgi:hypothetical protein